MNEQMVTGIYIRVSTDDQAKDGFSINAQKEKLTKYAEANDWKIYDYYIDDGISGKNLVDRKEVSRLLNDVKKGIINNILIYKLDRLTRSLKDLIYLIELFEKYKCTFNSQTEKIDTSNAVGRMFVKIIGIFAEFERENLAERVSFGYEQKTREGNYTNTNGVYGYDYIVGKKILVVNLEEKILINRIYDLYINGMTYYKIAILLNNEKVKTKRGGKWSANTIKSILNNPLYIGKIRYGVSSRLKDKSFVVNGNNIEPLIDLYKWNLTKEIINERKNNNCRRTTSDISYYSTFLKCALCGEKMISIQQTHQNKKYISYCCKNKNCNSKSFSHKKIEKLFLNYIKDNFKFNNWIYLSNKQKRQVLQQNIDYINIESNKQVLMINNIIFK